MYLFIPVHIFMGPIHGAIVNWCGHKYGYESFKNGDNSKNSLPIDFICVGELMQNNHHRFPKRINFAVKKFEFDIGHALLRLLLAMKIIRLANEKNIL
jgi:stearoyl-CoA desaturase (Delta-9 desaturase)